jgi:hypothetical protein
MPSLCICQWASCLAYSNAFTEANHPVAGFYNISYGTRTILLRKMVEKHLSVADGVVKKKGVYKVARHHWPELLITKNKNESRSIFVPIYRTEAVLYGDQFVEILNRAEEVIWKSNRNDVLKADEGKYKYIQTPVVAEKTVSALVASLKSNRGQRVLSRSIPQESKIEEQLIVESISIDELVVDVRPSSLLSTSIEQLIVDTPSLPTINPPDDSATDPSLPTIDLDCDHNVEMGNEIEPINHHVEPFIDTDPRRLIVVSTTSPSIQLEPPPPIATTPNKMHSTNQPVFQPDSPDAYPSVEKIHEYIRRKVMQHGISHELLTFKFNEHVKLLQRMYSNFEPIVCQYGIDLKNVFIFPCPNLQIQKETCELMTIRQRFPYMNAIHISIN